MGGDHVVVTKSGKTTYGLDRFFSSLYGKVVPGLCFLSLSLLSVKHRRSDPVVTEQVEKPLEASVQSPPKQKQSGGPRGRPKGSKNRNRREVELSPSLCLIQTHIKRLLEQIGDHVKITYFVFNFRDAKQYWGLEDFMSVRERPVYNSANLAMFMVNLSHALIGPMREQWPACSVNDLKAWFRGQKYVVETLKLLPEPPDSIFIEQVVAQMAALGRVNHTVHAT